MIKLLLNILKDQGGGLGITRASMVSAICDETGDDSSDAVVKIKRLINQRGSSFCNITNWPFERSDISFDINAAGGYIYSGEDYLPTTYKKVTAAYLLDSTERYPLNEVGIIRAHEWKNPTENTGRPHEFCITRMESGYWEIQFNHKPDQTYTVYLEIELQWADLTADTSETLVTKEYYDAFVLYCSIARFRQQGDTENYQLAKDDWFNPAKPQDSMLYKCLAQIEGPTQEMGLSVDMGIEPTSGDYSPTYE